MNQIEEVVQKVKQKRIEKVIKRRFKCECGITIIKHLPELYNSKEMNCKCGKVIMID